MTLVPYATSTAAALTLVVYPELGPYASLTVRTTRTHLLDVLTLYSADGSVRIALSYRWNKITLTS